MKTLTFLVIICLSVKMVDGQNLRSETEYGLFYKHNCETLSAYNQIQKGDITYVFGKNVNLRADSTLDGKVIKNLELGEEVQVLDWTTFYAYEIGGHKERWYKIMTEDGKTGFIYGALLTKAFINYDLNKNGIQDLIMLGSNFLNPPFAEIKIIEQNQLIESKILDSLYVGDNCECLAILRIIKDTKLSDIEVIEIGSGSNFCVTFWRSNFIYFKEGKLKEIFSKNMRFYKGDPYFEIIFPSDEGGTMDQIKVNKCRSKSWEKPPFLECSLNEVYSFKNGEFEKIK